jgi:hypothetical protein
MYSLYANKQNMRKAKVGETLTSADYRSHRAFMTNEGSVAPMLACIRHDTTLVIDNMQFAPGTSAWIVAKYTGERMSVTFIDGSRSAWRHRGYAADSILLPDGIVIHFDRLAEGVTASIPRKARKDKGVARPRNLNKVLGLDQIVADLPPDPKPEDAPSEGPVPVEEPVKESEPKPEPAAA